MEPWVPITAGMISAVIALGAAWVAADLFTANTRLRRRLDKELSILDKMPEGYAKHCMTQIVEREGLDLVYRTQMAPPIEKWLPTYITCLCVIPIIFIVVPGILGLVFNYYEPAKYLTTGPILFIPVVAVIAGTLFTWKLNDLHVSRLHFISKHGGYPYREVVAHVRSTEGPPHQGETED